MVIFPSKLVHRVLRQQPLAKGVTVSVMLLFYSTAVTLNTAWASNKVGPISEKCAAEPYRAFDFWLGEWDVYAQGKLAGHNKITRILEGCAIAESWQSAGGGTGHSYNAYDSRAGTWSQFWVDTNGLVLRLVGNAQDGTMTMLGLVPVPDEPGATVRHEIRWMPQENGNVRQVWKSARSGSDEWQTVFDGLYVPAGSPPPAVTEEAGKRE